MPRDKDKFNQWGRENIVTFSVRLSRNKDPKMIAWMENHRPSNDYLKGLILEDMDKHTEESSKQQ